MFNENKSCACTLMGHASKERLFFFQKWPYFGRCIKFTIARSSSTFLSHSVSHIFTTSFIRVYVCQYFFCLYEE